MADFSIVVFYLFQVNNLFKNLKKFRSNFYHKTRLIFLRFFRRKIRDEKKMQKFLHLVFLLLKVSFNSQFLTLDASS